MAETVLPSLTPTEVAPARRRRVLYFAPKTCWPPDTGAKLRNFHLARELARSADVTYLGFSEPGVTTPPPEGVLGCPLVAVRRQGGYSLSQIARGFLGPIPLPILNYTTAPMSAELERILEAGESDIVQIEGIHLSGYLPLLRAPSGRPILLCDWHNVESELMDRYGDWAKSPLKRFYAKRTAKRLAEVEREALHSLDAHIVVSARDKAQLLSIAKEARVFVVENGVDVEHYTDAAQTDAHARLRGADVAADVVHRRHRVVFVGSMDYHANIDAVLEFAHSIWPSVRARSSLMFTIVGRNPPAEVRALNGMPGVEVTGTVEDVRPFYKEAACAIVPLRVGGGSRLKILEAMAAGVPVVSTTLGAEGIECEDGKNIMIADGNDQMAKAIASVSDTPTLWALLSDNGRQLVRDRYDWKALGARLSEIHDSLIAAKRRVFQVLPG